jgi:hypothetical protein
MTVCMPGTEAFFWSKQLNKYTIIQLFMEKIPV